MTQNNTVTVTNTSRGQNPLILSLAAGKGKNQGITLVIPPNHPTRDKPKGEVLLLTLEQLKVAAPALCRYVNSNRARAEAGNSVLSADDIKALSGIRKEK